MTAKMACTLVITVLKTKSQIYLYRTEAGTFLQKFFKKIEFHYASSKLRLQL